MAKSNKIPMDHTALLSLLLEKMKDVEVEKDGEKEDHRIFGLRLERGEGTAGKPFEFSSTISTRMAPAVTTRQPWAQGGSSSSVRSRFPKEILP